MNVGQILETHLGWSCSELGDQINKHMKKFEKDFDIIKSKLSDIYGKDYYEKIVSKLSRKEQVYRGIESSRFRLGVRNYE